MIQNSMVYLSIAAALLLGIVVVVITTEIDESEFVIVRSALAQTASTSSGNMNMTTPMMESASFHLMAADRLLMDGNTDAALDQVNLAEIQLSLLNMGPQETSINQTQAMEFVIGGSLSSMKMAANCIIDNQAMVSCMQ
jgi:ABC-type taurine transport system substrate-binding protein